LQGYYLGRNIWDLRNEWVAIPQHREEGLKNCKAIPNPSEQTKCIEKVEKWANEEKSKVYRSGFVLTVAGTIVGFKIKDACFSS